jgi:glycosylphosphatidylinositol transamidase (GPIT) subunit GPI8
MQGSVSFRDNDNTNINRHLSVDMRYNSMNARSVLNQLGLKYSRHTLNLHRLKLDNSPYLIYLTGHGGDFYFKIRERQALVSQNF